MLLRALPVRRTGVLAMLLIPFFTLSAASSPTPAAPLRQPALPHRLTDPVPDPHQPDVQWFAPTGHTLRGVFLAYWTRYGGLAQFGYPLTEEFTESNDPDGQNPLRVQYFERHRFEYHPENAGSPYEVLLGTLGRAFHAADSPVPAPTDPAIRYFPETGHTLAGAFLRYWETHGGLFVHGYPLTEPFPEVNPTDGKTYTVQYFERSRFEHHPENAGSPSAVLLGLLGEQLGRMKGYFTGTFPRYSHAADFSWVAGDYVPPGLCPLPECRCEQVRYDASNGPIARGDPGWSEAHVRLTGPGWEGAVNAGLLNNGVFYVFFGHLATLDEVASRCNVHAYVVEQAQANTTLYATK